MELPEFMRRWLRPMVRWIKRLIPWPKGLRDEVDVLYLLLYRLVHDRDNALDLSAIQTQEAFDHQWKHLSEGLYLLSDPWFKANVSRILSEEEMQIRAEWFRGKEVLDAGCGNGRWAFGFAELGANVTAVDINQVAVEETRKAIEPFPVRKACYVAPLEGLSRVLPPQQYDLVFCWGVLHHCKSFTNAFAELFKFVKQGGLLYLYLYGRGSLSIADDLELFKLRLRFHLMSAEEKHRYLLKKAKGNHRLLHNLHDFYAPLINRRFEFSEIKQLLERGGMGDVTRTIRHTELFIRAVKGDATDYHRRWFVPRKEPRYWFEHH